MGAWLDQCLALAFGRNMEWAWSRNRDCVGVMEGLNRVGDGGVAEAANWEKVCDILSGI